MDDELEDLDQWFSIHVKGEALIQAEDLPYEIDINRIDRPGKNLKLFSLLEKVEMPTQFSFDLGSITTGPSLMQSSASHRIERNIHGTEWKIYVSGPDFPNGEMFMGEIDSSLIMNEMRDLKYEISLREWISMGWRPSIK